MQHFSIFKINNYKKNLWLHRWCKG